MSWYIGYQSVMRYKWARKYD